MHPSAPRFRPDRIGRFHCFQCELLHKWVCEIAIAVDSAILSGYVSPRMQITIRFGAVEMSGEEGAYRSLHRFCRQPTSGDIVYCRLVPADSSHSERHQSGSGQAVNQDKIRSEMAGANSFRHACSHHRPAAAAGRCGRAGHHPPARSLCPNDTGAGSFKDPAAG
jgi:hypothetical protein